MEDRIMYVIEIDEWVRVQNEEGLWHSDPVHLYYESSNAAIERYDREVEEHRVPVQHGRSIRVRSNIRLVKIDEANNRCDILRFCCVKAEGSDI